MVIRVSHRNIRKTSIIFTFPPLFIMSSNKTSLQDRCKALSQSILKESTVFESSDAPSEDENAPSHAEDIRAQIQSAAGVVEHESTKFGLLFAKNEPIADDVSNSALDAFHVSLIAFTAHVNAALRANRSEGECYKKQVKCIGDSVLKASASLIDSVGMKKDNVRSLTASVWEQCKSAEKMPKDGKDAVGKALMAHCRLIKDAKREIEEMLEEGDDDGEQRKDGEKVEDDFGEEIIREEIKDVDREVLRKAKATIECTFTFLKALVVPLISKRSNSNNKSRIDRATALNEIEKKCKEIRRAVDEIICEAMPPSDAGLLATEAKKLKDAAENMMKRVEEVMTDNDATNDGQTEMNIIETAKKALDYVQSACAEM